MGMVKEREEGSEGVYKGIALTKIRNEKFFGKRNAISYRKFLFCV